MRISEESHPALTRPANASWTDACRESTEGSYSGAAGFSSRTAILWVYKFPKKYVDVLPIHLLEAVAELVNLAMTGPAIAGESAVAWCDNTSWVQSVRHAKPKDQRLRHLLAVRQNLEKRFNTTVHSAYVNTKRNVVADLASRGDVEEAFAELGRSGWPRDQVRFIDLNKNPELGPPDMVQLLDTLRRETLAKNLHR